MPTEDKNCYVCRQRFPRNADHFPRNAASEDGLAYACLACTRLAGQRRRNKPGVREKERATRRANRPKHAEALASYMKEYRAKNADKIRVTNQRNHREIRLAALEAYGSACACCGEKTVEFLVIDHVHEDGHRHRREADGAAAGAGIYWWLKKNNYPQDGRFQVLCYNCNNSKSLYGGCPHKTAELPYEGLQRRMRKAANG